MSQRRFTDKPDLNPQAVRSLQSDHPAMAENRTLFPSTVVTVTESEPARILISGRENRKLGATVEKGAFKGYALYGLSLEERATCPASCEARGFCYGNGMQLARRHRIGDADVFFDRLGFEIAELLDEHDGLLIRLHVLGDFPGVEYVAFWQDALEEHPKVACYGYTHHKPDSEIGKAINAVKSNYSHRFRIRWSGEEPTMDGATIIDEIPTEARHAKGLVCPAQTDDTACCATCGLCWEIAFSRDTIAFIKHGPKSAEAELESVTKAKTGALNMPRVSGDLRRCEALSFAGLSPAKIGAALPEFGWLAPSDLMIEEKYQRALSQKSLALIRKIVDHFDWTKFKPPVVAPTDGGFVVIDGQHSAIAAATHGGIEKIPVLIVPAAQIIKRADAFVAHNRDRIAMTPLQIFHAEVAAGDHLAIKVLKLAIEAGGEIPRNTPQRGHAKSGQFLCIHELRSIFSGSGPDVLLSVMRVCVKSGVTKIPVLLVRGLRIVFAQPYFEEVAALGEDALASAVAKSRDFDAEARNRAEVTGQRRERAAAALIADNAGVKLSGADIVDPVEEAGFAGWKLALTPQEQSVMKILMEREMASKDAIMNELYGLDPNGGAEPKIVDVFVYRMRKKLAPRGVEIKTIWGQGYQLTPESKTIVTSMMEAA